VNRGETERHRELKRLALGWALARGLNLAATEVRIPRSGWRADVAAAGGLEGTCAVFECKQSRVDLRRDAHEETAARARCEELQRRARALDELLAAHCPALRRGEALWPEFDTWDFSALRHRGRRALAVARAAAERRVREGTKFSRLRRYQAADELYLVVEPDCFAPADLPIGWGLLVRVASADSGAPSLRLERAPEPLLAAPVQRAALRAAIRRAAERAGALLCSGLQDGCADARDYAAQPG
jgi:hypothetical protein